MTGFDDSGKQELLDCRTVTFWTIRLDSLMDFFLPLYRLYN